MPSESGSVLTAYPAGFHEDDALRSAFMRQLMLTAPAVSSPNEDLRPAAACTIPQVLVRFWDAQLPADVQACLNLGAPAGRRV